MIEKPVLSGLLPEDIASLMPGEASFKGTQIFKWIANGAQSFDEMTNLSLELRRKLNSDFLIYSSSVHTLLRDPDGTLKLQVRLQDGLMIEAVLLCDREGRKTACLSTQAGCAMGCTFCKTGTLGFARNLTAAEIVEQFLQLERNAGTLQNIVFMGMGEPLLNLNAVRQAIAVLSHKAGRNLSVRRITLSTCGIIEGIYDLADKGPAVRLAVSLTTADPELREKLMPVAKSQSLHNLADAIRYYSEKTGHRCTLEAALMKGVNTGENSAQNLIGFARSLPVHINLIPWNRVEGLPYEAPSSKEVDFFCKALENAGLNVTVRTKRGSSVAGACGQLGKTKSDTGMPVA
ncbi:23S rRNA (adenine(2503)-C(2))-methyltransferase RlmN [Treponema sp. HNW]|uniref:23S rRNA (adenine(2503)-C(2))-methyltransferase RlmN n=1 Tax=Treponema sp. HNW TaxID=3116654 RepID=UPI003D14F8B7